MSYDLPIPYDKLNRYGRRSAVAMQRKAPQVNRKYNILVHQKREGEKIQEGIAYRIAKRLGDMPAVRLFRRKHPKLRKHFTQEDKAMRA